jgi:hypothetical protein
MPAAWAAWAEKVGSNTSSILQHDACSVSSPFTCMPSYNSHIQRHTQLFQQRNAEAQLCRMHAALSITEEDTSTTLIQALQQAVVKLASVCKAYVAAAAKSVFKCLQQVQPAAARAATEAADRYTDTLLLVVALSAAKFIGRVEYKVSIAGVVPHPKCTSCSLGCDRM